MNKSTRQLATWSFLVASAHGAGLMVLPFILGATTPMSVTHQHHGELPMVAAGVVVSSAAFAAPVIHTIGYLIVTTVLAVVVYEKIGLRILRRAWINLHVIWAVALIGAGATSMLVE